MSFIKATDFGIGNLINLNLLELELKCCLVNETVKSEKDWMYD